MKRIVYILLLFFALSSCGVTAKYIGKSYAPTNHVELYMIWEDVPRDYEVMGFADATPNTFSSIEVAQKKLEEMALKKGADAIVFDEIEEKYLNPALETIETTEKDIHGVYTTRVKTVETADIFSTLKVTFIKFRK